MKKITYRCPECGSEDIVADAAVRWDKGKQIWKFVDLYSHNMTCPECGTESSYGMAQMELEEEKDQ